MTNESDETGIAAAFEELRREVSLARAAVEGLTAARERMPDYGPTLAAISETLKSTAAVTARIERSPAVSLSPEAMTAEIVKAGAGARSADAKLIHDASAALSRGCGQIDLMIKRGQAADRQLRQKGWIGVSGLLAGVLLWSFLPGTIARSLPADWAMPERLAAGMIGTDRWNAGQRMMGTANLEGWRRVVAATARATSETDTKRDARPLQP